MWFRVDCGQVLAVCDGKAKVGKGLVSRARRGDRGNGENTIFRVEDENRDVHRKRAGMLWGKMSNFNRGVGIVLKDQVCDDAGIFFGQNCPIDHCRNGHVR